MIEVLNVEREGLALIIEYEQDQQLKQQVFTKSEVEQLFVSVCTVSERCRATFAGEVIHPIMFKIIEAENYYDEMIETYDNAILTNQLKASINKES